MSENQFFRVYYLDDGAAGFDREIQPKVIAPTVTTLPVAKALADRHVIETNSRWATEWFPGYKNGERYWTRGFDTGNELAVMVIAPGKDGE